ncbi:Hypothetical predicted protein [Olea europaea subsp. europaea]|uniref:Uncharacterized protein n=1 Tax=Olea europaea subsp. europaea TaxID=158383 RepID=A0A8S0SDA7_OLEEU|nr:Hypothetical predicted protein [Olea europaea subsp. europaea]
MEVATGGKGALVVVAVTLVRHEIEYQRFYEENEENLAEKNKEIDGGGNSDTISGNSDMSGGGRQHMTRKIRKLRAEKAKGKVGCDCWRKWGEYGGALRAKKKGRSKGSKNKEKGNS